MQFYFWFGDSWFCQSHTAPGTACRSQGRSSCIISWSHSTTASDNFQVFHFDIYLAHAILPLTHFWRISLRDTQDNKNVFKTPVSAIKFHLLSMSFYWAALVISLWPHRALGSAACQTVAHPGLPGGSAFTLVSTCRRC